VVGEGFKKSYEGGVGMIVWFPSPRKNKTLWLGPYHYRMEEMIDPIRKIYELILCGAYIELESGEEELAQALLREMEPPFKEEFAKVVSAALTAQRVLNELTR
jgi:hypothetical protein